ncbi:MAG: hypothetical protein KME12_04000 [Trichocoleus desertorum ATA4-8-CV12]|nr:hypothetical protein [Trichocoleus desertorum ATA4-8-CV12]
MFDTFLISVLRLLYFLIQLIQPILVPICFITAWGLIVLVSWNTWSAVRDGVNNAKKMHRIPCANCEFFTGDYHLKCTVHPDTALSEDAIYCRDYEPTSQPLPVSHRY